MPLYDLDPNDLTEARAEYARVQRRANRLRRHAWRNDRDPDALSDEEREELEELEGWEP